MGGENKEKCLNSHMKSQKKKRPMEAAKSLEDFLSE